MVITATPVVVAAFANVADVAVETTEIVAGIFVGAAVGNGSDGAIHLCEVVTGTVAVQLSEMSPTEPSSFPRLQQEYSLVQLLDMAPTMPSVSAR